MKRFLFTALVLCLCASLPGCGDKKPQGPDTAQPPVDQPFATVDYIAGDDLDYQDMAALGRAIDEAIKAKTFLGYTDPFSAFPDLDGPDTISGAFRPHDNQGFRVFFNIFNMPGYSFHKQVYGYVVRNEETQEEFGHFDGDANGSFEQNSLTPNIDFGKYEERGDIIKEQGEQ